MTDDKRDKELDQMLAPLKRVHPTARQAERWLVRALREPQVRYGRFGWAMQLGAAVCVGFLIGAIFFKDKPLAQENSDAGATIEMIYHKG